MTFGYSSENQLTSASGAKSASLSYDPLMRLTQVTSSPTTTRFAYDGLATIAEYDGVNLLLRRYVHGPGMDEPLVQHEGTGTTDRRFLAADERGSIVAVTDSSGALLAANSYDEYGIPGSGNVGRFQYTGQMWLPEVGLYHYKNRAYSPTLGRFLQTDPIGYGDGLNMYAYVGNDPTNNRDPSGLSAVHDAEQCTGTRLCQAVDPRWGVPGLFGGVGNGGWAARGGGIRVGGPAHYDSSGVIVVGNWQYIYFPSSWWSGFLSSSDSWHFNAIVEDAANVIDEVADSITQMLCAAPAIQGGGGWDGYYGLGGSMSGALSFNPRNGQLSVGFDLGVGVGAGGGVRGTAGGAIGAASASNEPARLFGGGINANATGVAGPLGGLTGSYQLLGSSPGAWSISGTRGSAVGVNANISGHGEANFPALYGLDCLILEEIWLSLPIG